MTEPLTDEEIEQARAAQADGIVPAELWATSRWLATVDALRARLEEAEKRARGYLDQAEIELRFREQAEAERDAAIARAEEAERAAEQLRKARDGDYDD